MSLNWAVYKKKLFLLPSFITFFDGRRENVGIF